MEKFIFAPLWKLFSFVLFFELIYHDKVIWMVVIKPYSVHDKGCYKIVSSFRSQTWTCSDSLVIYLICWPFVCCYGKYGKADHALVRNFSKHYLAFSNSLLLLFCAASQKLDTSSKWKITGVEKNEIPRVE